MPFEFSDLSAAAQTAYANVQAAASARALDRDVSHLRGSFAAKSVKGKRYWYFQYEDLNGRRRQLYIGPDNDRIGTLVERRQATRSDHTDALARAALALGCGTVARAHFLVVSRLEEYGFFGAGGVLIGTHAFVALGNLLGVRWTDATATTDIDFAHADRDVSIALPSSICVNTRAAVESLEMGFLPMTASDGTASSSFRKADKSEFQIDFLVPRAQRRGAHAIEALGIVAEPLPFLEFVLEDTTQAAVLANAGAVTINVPAPERFALHKLIVAGERSAQLAVKSAKDLRQAAALLAVLERDRPAPLEEARRNLLARGAGWQRRYRAGLARLR